MTEAVVVDGIRTPFGRAGGRGVLKDITHVELVVSLLKAIVERNKLDPNLIDEFNMGSVFQSGTITRSRMYLFEAGFPDSISGTDMNKQCGSALQGIVMGSHAIMNGMSDIVLAGGVDTMDRLGPIPPGGDALTIDNPQVMMEFMKRESWQMYPDKQAKLLPQWFNLKASQERAVAAQDAGKFDREIVPISIEYLDGRTETIDKDQNPRRESNLEKLSTLKGAYKADGAVTAGNSCPRTDGATMVLLMSKEKAKELGYKPLLTFRAAATVGTDPEIMGIGPLPATQKLLQRTGMSLDQFDLIELNEAFACQVAAVMRGLGTSEWDERLNVNGGAVALGHPLGATGGRLVATMAYEMERRNARWGLTTLCMGSGMGMSVAWEREG
jgi:acetyl-CoA acetyltransferase